MPAFLVPAIMAGVSALQGYLANRSKVERESKGQSHTNTTQNSTQTTDATTNPTYDPLQLKMRDFILNTLFNRAQPGSTQGLVDNYIGQGTNTINHASGQNEQALSAALAAHGLSYSPVAGQALGQQQSDRIGQITNLQTQAPLLQDQLQQSRLTDFSSFLKGLPTGTHTTGTQTGVTNTVGDTTSSGQISDPNRSPVTGALGTLSQTLANLYGQGAFGNVTKPKKDTLNV